MVPSESRSSVISVDADLAEGGEPVDGAPPQVGLDRHPGVGLAVEQPALQQHRVRGGPGQAEGQRHRDRLLRLRGQPRLAGGGHPGHRVDHLAGGEVARDQGAERPPQHGVDDADPALAGQVAGEQPEEARPRAGRRSGPCRTPCSTRSPGCRRPAPRPGRRRAWPTTARPGGAGRRSRRRCWGRRPQRPGSRTGSSARSTSPAPSGASVSSYVATVNRWGREPERVRVTPSASRVTVTVSKPVVRSQASTQPRTSRSVASSRASTKSARVALPNRCRAK